MKFQKPLKILTIGGGSGQFVLLSGLRDLINVKITSVVSMVDSGGSTGRLRDEWGILPPGDVLKCLLALSPNRETARRILQTKFIQNKRLKGHNAGNMLLGMLAQYTGSFPDGINALGEILKAKGTVLPVTTDRATLVAELTNGEHLYGETTIDIPISPKRAKIKKVFLVPHHTDSIKVYPPVLRAIQEANFIIIGPGDLYTSILPNFLIQSVTKELARAHGKLIYISNIMTKFGETDGFSVLKFVQVIKEKIKREPDHIIVNKQEISQTLIKKYKQQQSELVKIDQKIIQGDSKYILGDLVNSKGGVVRHDSQKLTDLIKSLI